MKVMFCKVGTITDEEKAKAEEEGVMLIDCYEMPLDVTQARLDGMKECLEIAQAFKRLELRKDVWEERMVKWCNGYKSAITDTTRAIEAAMEANDD